MNPLPLSARAGKYVEGGVSLIPVGGDKKPFSPALPRDADDKPTWKPFRSEAADLATVQRWCASPGVKGVAAVCGGISGGLLILDFDETRLYERWLTEVGPLADGLPKQRTGDGYQVAMRCDDPGRSTVLAYVPDDQTESGRRVGIETRGEGGYAVFPGSLHPSGRTYEAIEGDFANIPHIEMSRVRLLLAAARQLDEAPQTKQELEKAKAATLKPRKPVKHSVIDEWNQRVPIRVMLERAGYIPFRDRYTRPGDDASLGSVIVFEDSRRSFHHSTNDPLHGRHAHDSFGVFCETQHGGDAAAAVKAAATELGLDKAETAEDHSEEDSTQERRSQATLMVHMVEANADVELFHTPGGTDSLAFARFKVGDHFENRSLHSKGFRQWLSRQFYLSQGKVPGGQAVTDAINALSGKAIFEGAEHAVHLRIADHRGEIWIDLGDEEWRAVRITADGWEVVARDIPVRFTRRRGMLPLPVPERGGSIEQLRPLVNLPDDDQWALAVAWLVAAFRPGRPFTVLNVTGEQGSAKSTLCKMLRALIDPAKPALRRPPKDDRDLMIAANNSWVVGYDNISSISDALSDSLCSLATGGGFATRQLYTDDDESIFDATRPVVVNGIDDAVTRPDLLDRSINLHLPVIPKEQRRDEDAVWAEFNRLRPHILGALFTAVSTALRNVSSTRLPEKPRMADFATWVVAAEPSLPWARGRFLTAYTSNRDEGDTLALEASAIAGPIFALLTAEGEWAGSAGDLLKRLTERYADDQTRHRKDWPATPKVFAGALRRIAPNLRRSGVLIEPPKTRTGHAKHRIWRLAISAEGRAAWAARAADPPQVDQNTGEVIDPAAHRPPNDAPSDEERAALQELQSPPEAPKEGPAARAARAAHTPEEIPHGWDKLGEARP